MSDMRPSWHRIARAAKEVLFGMTLHGFLRFNLRQKGHLENLLILVTFGDLLGLPIMPPYYPLLHSPDGNLASAHPAGEGFHRLSGLNHLGAKEERSG